MKEILLTSSVLILVLALLRRLLRREPRVEAPRQLGRPRPEVYRPLVLDALGWSLTFILL